MQDNDIELNLCNRKGNLWTSGPAVMILNTPEAAKVFNLLFIKILMNNKKLLKSSYVIIK